MADFGAIVHRREPDNPVKDGALSKPFFRLPGRRSAETALFASAKRRPFLPSGKKREAFTENGKRVAERL